MDCGRLLLLEVRVQSDIVAVAAAGLQGSPLCLTTLRTHWRSFTPSRTPASRTPRLRPLPSCSVGVGSKPVSEIISTLSLPYINPRAIRNRKSFKGGLIFWDPYSGLLFGNLLKVTRIGCNSYTYIPMYVYIYICIHVCVCFLGQRENFSFFGLPHLVLMRTLYSLVVGEQIYQIRGFF